KMAEENLPAPTRSDEQLWLTLNSDLLRDALEITLVDPVNPFVSPLAGEIVMDFMNDVGYPEAIHFCFPHACEQPVSAVESNSVFDQPVLNWQDFREL
ncbi:hypothetical protein Tco_1557314, partial [Tanacetum coccineum]